MPARRRLAGAHGYALRAGVVHPPRAGAVARAAVAVAGDAMVTNYHRRRVSCFARIGRPRRRNAGPGGGPSPRLGHAPFARRGRLARWPARLRIPPLAGATLRQTRPGALLSGRCDRFSRLGVFSVGILLASGLINSWNLLNGPRDLMATDYGRLVALKIVLFAAMVAIAAVNRFYLTPRLPKPRRFARAACATAWRNRSRALRAVVRRPAWNATARRACPCRFGRHPARCRFCAHPHVRGHGRCDHRARPRRAHRRHDSRLARRSFELPGKGCAPGARSTNRRRPNNRTHRYRTAGW